MESLLSVRSFFLRSTSTRTLLWVRLFFTFLVIIKHFVAEDSVEKDVVMAVNGQECRIVFIDHEFGEMEVENMIQTYCPHALLIVMAVDDVSSMELAEGLLCYLSRSGNLEDKAVILVANKTDLVRNREIKTSMGRELATKFNVKYIETSPGDRECISVLYYIL